eukprot:scaffold14119_cov428-Alexandrium_tamarense.AAC.2
MSPQFTVDGGNHFTFRSFFHAQSTRSHQYFTVAIQDAICSINVELGEEVISIGVDENVDADEEFGRNANHAQSVDLPKSSRHKHANRVVVINYTVSAVMGARWKWRDDSRGEESSD